MWSLEIGSLCLNGSKIMEYAIRKDSGKDEHETPCSDWSIRPCLHSAEHWRGFSGMAIQHLPSTCLCRIVKMHDTSELASAATATSPRWKRCITGFAFLSRLTAASKHFSTYLLPILLEVPTHFLAGACFLEGTEVTCHFLSHVT